jgi:hypothetical protein
LVLDIFESVELGEVDDTVSVESVELKEADVTMSAESVVDEAEPPGKEPSVIITGK